MIAILNTECSQLLRHQFGCPLDCALSFVERAGNADALIVRSKRDTITSVLSHDLRNPLNVGASRLELAGDESDSEHIDHVMAAVDRGLDLIQGVRVKATMEHEDLEAEAVELSSVVDRSYKQ